MNPLNEDNKSQLLESPFECNICLDIATEPMLTTCGHLYCWPCIYAWLNSNQEFLTCPVCKNGCPRNSLIPLYSKNEDHKARPRDPNIPMRPKPDRNEPIRNVQNGGQNNLNNATMVAGYGLFPSLISLVNIKEGEIDKDVHTENDSQIELQNLKFMKALLGVFIGFFCLIVVLYF